MPEIPRLAYSFEPHLASYSTTKSTVSACSVDSGRSYIKQIRVVTSPEAFDLVTALVRRRLSGASPLPALPEVRPDARCSERLAPAIVVID